MQLDETVCVIGGGKVELVAVGVADAMSSDVDVLGVEVDAGELVVRRGARCRRVPAYGPVDAYSVEVEAPGAAASALLMIHVASSGGWLA
jgi:hypothetical protein